VHSARGLYVTCLSSSMTWSAHASLQRDVQEHELALIREYEARLLAKESENLLRALSSTTAESISLGRISTTLRTLLRVLNGEDASPPPSASDSDNDFEERDWALERECELARLERENAVLRRLLGLEVREPDYMTRAVEQPRAPIPRQSEGVTQKRLGGAPGTVGPYGTYKRSSTVGRVDTV
jgi:hypothetical protein